MSMARGGSQRTKLNSFLDGEHAHTIKALVKWDVPAFLQMAIETYHWNPLPADGGMVESGTWEQRTTQYDWIRTWRPKPVIDQP